MWRLGHDVERLGDVYEAFVYQGERRGIITQMQLLSTRKEDGHQPLSTATRQQGNERKVHKGNVFGTESRG